SSRRAEALRRSERAAARGRRVRRLEWIGGAAEAHAVRVGVAVHREAERRIEELAQRAVEVAAADHERVRIRRASGVPARGGLVAVEALGGPFEHVADQVLNALGAGAARERADR